MAEVKKFPVEKEYEKNPDILPEEVRKLREWLDTQPHLPGGHVSGKTRQAKGDFVMYNIEGSSAELELVLAYHCCERSLEVSKQVVDLHYTLRTLFTSFFKDRSFDSRVEAILHTVLFAPLPAPSVFGYRILYMRLLDLDPRNFLFNDVVRTFMMVFDLWQYEEGTWPGLVLIIDMDKASVGHVTKLEVMAVKKVLYFVQECMFVRLKEVHFMNAPSFIDKLMLLLRPFLKKALLDIISVHVPGAASLHQYIPRDALPREEGGLYKTHAEIRDETIQRFKSNGAYFREENLRRVNESLRPGGATAVHDSFGLQGSFKKLDID